MVQIAGYNLSHKPRMVLVATYPSMASSFMQLASEYAVHATTVFASFEEAVAYAKQHEGEIDIILSRGGTADYIKRAVSTPVVFIPITPFDVVQVIHKLSPSVGQVAFIHYREKLKNIHNIEEMYNISIKEYTFLDRKDIHRAVLDAREQGITTIIGGQVGVDYAKSLGMSGFVISAGEFSVHHAFFEAIQLFAEKEKEKEKMARLSAALGSLSEGLIVVDEQQKIALSNQAAEHLLGVPLPPGEPLPEAVRDVGYRQVIQQQTPQAPTVKRTAQGMLTVSHSPIVLNGQKFIGTVSVLEDVTKIQRLEKQIRHEIHTKGLVAKYCFEDILTEDSHMIELKKLLALVSCTDSSVLIEGESGTGKELFAQSIHNASNRAKGPFVAINCAAIPENLLESELFGYEPGAFSGAKREGKMGVFELAHNGTIFLDEIGELPLPLQTRLLRVLQEKEVRRVGGDKIIPVDIRVISATNQDLGARSREKHFRADLYYRLNVFNVHLPPLRQRGGDIRLLAEKFLQDIGYAHMDPQRWARYLEALEAYPWPGNIRELQNIVERIAVFSQLSEDDESHMKNIFKYNEEPLEDLSYSEQGGEQFTVQLDYSDGLKQCVDRMERQLVNHLLQVYHNDLSAVAQKLQVGKTTLWRMRSKREDPISDFDF